MVAELGKPRHPNAGRRKGTPNKKSLLVGEILDNHGINLIEQILVRLKEVSKKDQLQALVQILPYVYPKLTSTELSGAVEGLQIVINDYSSKKNE